jgi:hypothetical protein
MPQRVVVAEHDTWRTPSDAFAATAALQLLRAQSSRLRFRPLIRSHSPVPTAVSPHPFPLTRSHSPVPAHPFPLTRSRSPVPAHPFPRARFHSAVPLWLRRHFTLRRWGRPDGSLAPHRCAQSVTKT